MMYMCGIGYTVARIAFRVISLRFTQDLPLDSGYPCEEHVRANTHSTAIRDTFP